MDSAVAHRGRERRRARRRRALPEHGITAVRIRPGHDALVIDISANGVLIETVYRLLPGRTVDLQFESPARRTTVRGVVVRCSVTALRSWAVTYRGAISFDTQLPWLETDGK